MSSPLQLLLGVHAHQPVGNFAAVVAEAHERCYRPFLQTLYRYPAFRFSAHVSGWLLDELMTRYPEDMALLQEMVKRGQAELFGAGEAEPVLAAIPAHDRVGQIAALSHKLATQFGARPIGAWLTERVWESVVVPALASSGIRYVTVDDYHFLCTGKTSAELDGFYTTEEDGRTLDLFPISEALRYRLPFSLAADVVTYLEGLADAGQSAAIYFDDIEKFGIWPETFDWVYNRGWLEQFLSGVLASPKIQTATFADYHGRHKTRGIVYLPTASYSEMNEWTLPAPAARAYAGLLQQEKSAGRLEVNRPFIRGGIWRNFLTRYPEANWMHKRMLGLSARLAATPGAAADPQLCNLLYRAQANDAYWHGLFGGLYLPHLRRAVWTHLLALETALDAQAPRTTAAIIDLDYDGHEELFLHNTALQAVIRDDGRAAPHEFDSYALQHNFGDTLRRSDEHYYGLIGQRQDAAHADPHDGGIINPHERVAFKHAIAAADIIPDHGARALFMDTLVTAVGKRYRLGDYTRTAHGETEAEFMTRIADGVRLAKRFVLEQSCLSVCYTLETTAPVDLECEFHLAMPSCDGFAGRYVLADGSIPCGFGQELNLEQMTEVSLEDAVLGGKLVLSTNTAVRLEAAPHATVSQSEAGFEKIMQAARLVLRWRAGGNAELVVKLAVLPLPAAVA